MASGDRIDFQLLFESAPVLHLVLLPDLTIVGASDAYLFATMTKGENIFGRNLFEVFPDNPNDPSADGVRNLKASLNTVLATRSVHRMEIQKYDIRRPDGTFEVRYWSPMNAPVFGKNDEVRYILHTVTDVTAHELTRKEGRDSTRKAQQLLQSSIESLQDILVFSIDREYRLLHYNSAFKKATIQAYGVAIEVGMILLDCITNLDDRMKAKTNLDIAMKGRKLVTVQEYGEMDRSYFETRYNPLLNDEGGIIGATVLTTNITERTKADLELRRLASIVDSTVDAVISESLDGSITSWNQGAQRLLGYALSEVRGQNAFELTEDGDSSRAVHIMSQVRAGETMENYETRWKRRDGDLVDVSLSISPLKSDNGKVIGISTIARDITERTRAAANIRLMNQQLEEARKTADLANQTKSQFLANMSHEIRTPLNAVIGLSHLMLRTDLSAKQRDYLSKIESSGESLLRIVNDILDFSKVESGKLTLEENNFDLEEIFQQLGNVITYKANAKGLEVAFGIESNVPTFLIGDSSRLEQILLNLCSNAVKFTDEGEVVVNVRMTAEEGDRIQLFFEVTDTGIGMDRAQQSKLFQPFTQADDTISRKYGGTGLGLSILKRLVELMNGEVGVESEPGKGSRFYFDVWLKKQLHQRKMPAPSLDVRKWSVLLVDDNEAARTILLEALTALSFRVTAVSSGIQAIHYLKNNFHHDPVKLVLMDWKMPDMDGTEATRIIRADEQLNDVKIMMVCTSYASEDLLQAVEELRVSGILIKPIRYSALYDSIMAAVENGSRKMVGNGEIERSLTTTSFGNLLLVEDNEINQLVAVDLLQGFGFKVTLANNGQEAVQMMKRSMEENRLYDLVLMDLQMPVMGGRAATQEIRKMDGCKQVPIVAMTADAMVSVREECLSAGMNDFISKPINPNNLLETIEKWISPNRKAPVLNHKRNHIAESDTNQAIDFRKGLSFLGDNKSLYLELLDMFSTNNEHFVDELKSRITKKDAKEAIRMVHSLKGLSGSLGMTRLHLLSKDLQELISNENESDLNKQITDLDSELSVVRRTIRQIKDKQ